MKKLRVLDLFSGIGGFSLGLERTGGFETVAFCEIEAFPRRILAKHWPGVPIHDDVRKLKGADIGAVDVVCGGYPCQPFSMAGKRRGAEDDRHLWPEFNRLVAELRPAWVIGENVAGHISMGLDNVLSDLEGQGYAVRTFVIPACAVDAPHRRDRTWVIAHAAKLRSDGGEHHARSPRESARADQDVFQPGNGGRADAPDSDSLHDEGVKPRIADAEERCRQNERPARPLHAGFHRGLPTEPPVRGADDGVPRRLDGPRLKALGNAVHPGVVSEIGRAILEAEGAA